MMPKILATGVLLPAATWLFAADAETPTSAEFCGRCHRAIHEAWKQSAHAGAMESRLFQDALELAEAEGGSQARQLCLQCHSPVGSRLGDYGLRLKISWEGVTCDFCHSIRQVIWSGVSPQAQVEFSLVKMGTIKDAASGAHGSEYSALHGTAEVCAPCHEYTNAHGLAVLATYTEWKGSPAAAAGQVCQSCHMTRVAGDVVDPRIQRSRDARVNLHSMPGSRSLQQLTRAIAARLDAVRQGDQVLVTVQLHNRAAGHRLPSGSPVRRLNLTVRIEGYDGSRAEQQRVYTRRVADPQGRELSFEHRVFLKGARELADNRLKPDERRTEHFLFPLPARVKASVKATLAYYYSPMARDEQDQRVVFLTLQRLLP